MSLPSLEAFFGLGFRKSQVVADQHVIGFKGHGTKIYYQAQEVYVSNENAQIKTCTGQGVRQARESVYGHVAPEPKLYEGKEASEFAVKNALRLPDPRGTFLRLVDFTPEIKGPLIDDFKTFSLENYIPLLLAVFDSFEHVVEGCETCPPPSPAVARGTDLVAPKPPNEVEFGSPLALRSQTSLPQLRRLDDRRPFPRPHQNIPVSRVRHGRRAAR